LELVLADMQVVSKRLVSVEKEVRSGDRSATKEKTVLEKLNIVLEEGKLLRSLSLSEEDLEAVHHLNLLTLKPILYVLNVMEGTEVSKELTQFIETSGSDYVVVDAKVEEDVKDFEGEEKESFRSELGGKDSQLDTLITKSYKLLNLITFLTTGEKETRAWTCLRGSTAPVAGASIHTDFKDKFI